MDSEYQKIEDRLFADGMDLLQNGHRMTYVFKYVRGKAVDDEMRMRVMERLSSTDQVKEMKTERRKNISEARKLSRVDLIGGILVIVFACFITRVLWDSGWVSTLPLALVASVLIYWNRK